MERTPTTICANCGKEYAARSPACPYCSFVPRRRGSPALRWIFVTVGSVISLGIAAFVYLAEKDSASLSRTVRLAAAVLVIGVFLTYVAANKIFGGGKDI